MSALMLFADITAFLMAGFLVYLLNIPLRLFVFTLEDLRYLAVLLMCLTLYCSSRLYPGVGINPAEEIRLVALYTSLGCLIGVFVLGLIRFEWRPNYWALFPACGFSVLSVLLMRWVVRMVSVRIGMWGEPIVVYGSGGNVNQLTRFFLNRRRLGFIPTLIVTNMNDTAAITSPVPMMNSCDLFECPVTMFSGRGIHTVLVDISDGAELLDLRANKMLARLFSRVIYASGLDWMEGASLHVHDFEGLMGVEASKHTLSPLGITLKRLMDISGALFMGLFTLPVTILAALWIKRVSPGPVFYIQERVGMDRRHIRVYKFRTMVQDADQLLDDYLSLNPAEQKEWEQTQKLRCDPRVIRGGDFLRKFSIDELPQIFNVLLGEMSLVGPRPMMADQVKLYGENIEAYCAVRPGITGLWQVSGRNHTTFQERARFDRYYIHNWSLWLDMYILTRTVWVVLSRDGAY
jgi:Undecaprenyl-phosphate galactose phosphotransferase WbaP